MSNALLVRHDRIAQAMGQQDARRRARLVAGILVDDRIDHAVQQEPARVCTVSSWAIQTISRARPAPSSAAAMPRLPAPAL